MNPLEYIFLPKASGLHNTGSICYFNSLLQVLVSCTSLRYWKPTIIDQLVAMFQKCVSVSEFNVFDSSELLAALRIKVPQFGHGQESASEALSLLLNSINNDELSNMFIHRFKYVTKCINCLHVTEQIRDHSMFFEMFHTTEVNVPNMINHKTILSDYKCDKCANIGAIRISKLTMLPEIIICLFNVYYEKRVHSFPQTLAFPGTHNNELIYTVVGQIEHFGSLSGGHYISRALRNDGVYLFNDLSFTKSKFEPTVNTYIVVYHLLKNK